MISSRTKRFRSAYYATSGFGGSIGIIGALFKIMHWPGAAIALVLASALLIIANIFYFKFKMNEDRDKEMEQSFYDSKKEMSQGSGPVPLHITSESKGVKSYGFEVMRSAGMSLVVVGAVFKILHWPYGFQILFAGLIITAIGYFGTDFKNRQ